MSADVVSAVPKDAIDIVKAYFAAAHQDEAALLAVVAEDGVIHVPESLPYGGQHHGHFGFRQALAGFGAAWRDVQSHDFVFVAADDLVVVLSRMTATSVSSGRSFETRVAETFHIVQGKVAEVRPYYFDTAALLSALVPA